MKMGSLNLLRQGAVEVTRFPVEAEDSPEQFAERQVVQPVPDEEAALIVENVSHSFGDAPVLRDMSLSVGRGEIVCLVGPSGCGKTTTLRLVAGLEVLRRGRIAIGGRVVSGDGPNLPVEERNVGLMFQDYALFPHMKVIDNVTFGIRGVRADARRARGLSALADVGLEGHANGWPHMLSGGQQQRVALARALAPKPRLMLLDEPFSGLDSQLRGQVRDDTMHLLKGTRAATLMVTHDPEEAMFMADRIAVMRGGRIVQIGTPVDIYCHPASAFVCSFFSDVNRLDGVVRDGWVDTPLGQVSACDVENGAAVEVLIRPEALRLTPADAATSKRSHARVLAARMLGRTSLVHLSLKAATGDVHLHARVPGRFLPSENAMLAVALDSEQTFVFPAGETI